MEDEPHNVKCVSSLRDRDRWLAGVNADATLTPAALHVAISLALHLNIKSGRCDPSIVGLTERCAIKNTRTTERAITALEEAGWISRSGSRGRHRNRYSLRLARLIEDTSPADAPRYCDDRPTDTSGFSDTNPGDWDANPDEPVQPTPPSQSTQPRPGDRTNNEGNSVKGNTEGNNDGGDIPRADGSQGKKARTKTVDPSLVPAHFDDFWLVYPRKFGRHAAEQRFAAAVRGGAEPASIIEGARRYARDVAHREERFIKEPGNWLRDKAWLDAPSASAGGVTLDERGNVVEMRPRPQSNDQRPASVTGIFHRMYAAGYFQ
jgi:hypothetical protein